MNIINKIYRCKNTILDMLDIRGYNTEKYKNFSLNEIDVMYKSMEKKVSSEPNGLDFECIKDEANSYIKFILHTKLRLANLKTLVDNMIEDYVKSGETIIFVVKAMRNGGIPISSRRGIVVGASLVCRVESTKCPVMAA